MKESEFWCSSSIITDILPLFAFPWLPLFSKALLLSIIVPLFPSFKFSSLITIVAFFLIWFSSIVLLISISLLSRKNFIFFPVNFSSCSIFSFKVLNLSFLLQEKEYSLLLLSFLIFTSIFFIYLSVGSFFMNSLKSKRLV